MPDAIAEAQRLYQEALDATAEQRAQIAEDLEFSDPSDPQQWDKKLKSQRENDPGGARPCLVFDQSNQYVANVAGQVEQAPPALHALPAGDGADKKVAEQLDGFFRHIEHVSRAKQHYTRALTSAARTGVGYLIVRPEYVNRALNWQEPRISSEGDPLRVVLDPWSVELDGSDADFGYLLLPYSHRAFERKYGAKAEKVSFADEDKKVQSDDRQSLIVAERWQAEDKTVTMFICTDMQTGDECSVTEEELTKALQDPGNTLKVAFDEGGKPRSYKDKKRIVKWATMSGCAFLEEEREYPASGIGIVPVYGYVGWSDGRMHYCGIPRRAMSAQRSYNLHMSEMQAIMGQAAKAPYMIPIRAFGGDENLKNQWDRASVDNRAFMPWHDSDETGPISPPQRMQPGVNLQNHIAGAQQAIHDIQASLGMYQASLGAPSNESSGVAIDARKQQGEAATAHFPSHLSAGLGQVGKLCMEMIPRLIDTKRQARILGIDETPGTVTIDPEQKGAFAETQQGLSINPNVGRYDVRVVTGASFSTQRAQAQAAFTEMMRANPAMAPALAPLWAQTLDVPHADKLAQVLTAVAPPEVRAVLNPEADKQPTTADLMARMQQLQEGLQEAIQHAHDAQAEADECKRRAEEAEDKAAIAAYEAKTKRMVGMKDAISPEQVQALVVQTIQSMFAQPDPMEEPGEPGPEAWQGQVMPMEGPGADGSEQHEMAEAPQLEQQEGPEVGEGAM